MNDSSSFDFFGQRKNNNSSSYDFSWPVPKQKAFECPNLAKKTHQQ
jgi:hypothetical protein